MGGETQLETSYWQLTEKMNKTLNRFLKQHQDTDDIDDCTSSILHAFIAKILCSKTLLKTYPRQPIAPDEIGTLSSEEQADLHDTATHIATRIKELILQQDICLKSFQYIRESDDTKCIIEYDEPEPETKDKIQNLLDNNELRDLWTLLTNLQPYVLHAPPNPHFQTNESSLVLSILISLDIFKGMTKDQPQKTQTTPHTPELAGFLQRHQEQRTVS
jgi:hypothetical protein